MFALEISAGGLIVSDSQFVCHSCDAMRLNSALCSTSVLSLLDHRATANNYSFV